MYHYCRETESWTRHDASAQVSGLCADTVRAVTGLVRATMHVCRCRWAGIWHPRPATAAGCATAGSRGGGGTPRAFACFIGSLWPESAPPSWGALAHPPPSLTLATPPPPIAT